jgi:hypothetical protein
MTHRLVIGLILGALTVPLAATPPSSAKVGETAINYAGEGGIRDWYAKDTVSIYLMDRTMRWYKATFSAPCKDLLLDPTIAFDAGVDGRLERSDFVHVRDVSCRIASLVRSERPAAKGGK